LQSFDADVFVVIAFRMLPEVVWRMPKKGTVNIHASLLPDYRGAAPINYAIINGEVETGVTSFLIQKEIDTGDILLQKKCEIKKTDNAGSLHEKLKHMGAELILETLDGIEKGNIEVIKQSSQIDADKKAPKLNTENTRIDFSKKALEISNLCRGLAPFPGAWCIFKQGEHEIILKVFCVEKTESDANKQTEISAKGPIIKCADGKILLTHLQPSGKKRMLGSDFARGIQLINGAPEIY